ncbi:MAG: oligopeptide ABC transporter ATP-binding protein OppF [Spirochaetae bacterium HGW-Spirochaetae-3]|jgi:oligopeptide/dipeptide ABC transporter ATP-binding protein|nr:MAG: oligopeptide ABC transporter ATP-binding protein OppF [Spirochaetae bacterium HGW-Spirochaetae-3]
MKRTNDTPLLAVEGLSKYFRMSRTDVLKAVDGVSFEVFKGETVGLVGESGCGKSTTGRCIVRLHEPSAGSVRFDGEDVYAPVRSRAEARARSRRLCKDMQMVFQNPYSSLNPRMTVKDIVGEGLSLAGRMGERERDERITELLRTVGLGADHVSRFPHEFSGGQRQRIGIARALSVDPRFIVCDEPISALDVSIQAQVINMLKRLQAERGLTYLFIAHDLSVVKYVSDRVIVMYLGTVVEQSESVELYRHPLHPYTRALFSAIPEADPRIAKGRERILLKGEIPSPINPKDECRFADRCPMAQAVCRSGRPPLRDMGGGHSVACFLA